MKLCQEKNSYRLILSSQLFLSIANWIDFFALLFIFNFILKYEVSATVYLVIFWMLPLVLLSPIAGYLSDKYSPKYIMMLGLFGCIISSLLLSQGETLWFFLLVVFFRGCVYSVLLPAEQVLINKIVLKKLFVKVCGYKGMISQVSKIIAPVLVSSLFTVIIINHVFYLSATLFIIALLSIALLTLKKIKKNIKPRDPVQFFLNFNSKRLLLSFLSSVLFMFFIFFFDPQFPALFSKLGYSANQFSLAIASAGIGGFIVSVIFSKIAQNHQLLWIQLGSILTNGIAIILLITVNLTDTFFPYITSVSIFFYCGLSTTLIFMSNNSIIQLDSDRQFIGQVTALQQSMQGIAILVGPLLGLLLHNLVSLESAFIIGGLCVFFIGFSCLLVNLRGKCRSH